MLKLLDKIQCKLFLRETGELVCVFVTVKGYTIDHWDDKYLLTIEDI